MAREVTMAWDWVTVGEVETDQTALARVSTASAPKAAQELYRPIDIDSRLRQAYSVSVTSSRRSPSRRASTDTGESHVGHGDNP